MASGCRRRGGGEGVLGPLGEVCGTGEKGLGRPVGCEKSCSAVMQRSIVDGQWVVSELWVGVDADDLEREELRVKELISPRRCTLKMREKKKKKKRKNSPSTDEE